MPMYHWKDSRAEENPTMTLRSLMWPDPSSRRSTVYKRLQAINTLHEYRASPGYARLGFAVAIVEQESRIISVLCDLFLKKRGTISCVVTGLRQITRIFNFVIQ